MAQRAAVHCSSQADNDEAFMAGEAAVKAAVAGETDSMVTLLRGEGDTYTCETGLAPLSEIANGVKALISWIGQWRHSSFGKNQLRSITCRVRPSRRFIQMMQQTFG